MNAMRYDALNVGALDLMLGVDTLLERQAQATFPFISANLVKPDGTLLLKPYVIVPKNNLRIGIIGLSAPIEEVLMRAPDVRDQLKTLDATIEAQRYVAELQDKVDIVVVLSRLGSKRDALLAEAVPGIDLIIGGEDRTVMDTPQRIGNTIIVQQGFQGEYLGQTEVTLDNKGQVSAATTQAIALGPEIADDPAMAGLIQHWNALYRTPTSSATD
ncbi:MAG: bifunctional UDP-sugar hydrolase/5'-nucleotidase [Anaerolineae bacterium]